jgi:glutamine amidotransferase PdxT
VVAVRQKSLLGISFHPEVTDEDRVHKYFIESMVSA